MLLATDLDGTFLAGSPIQKRDLYQWLKLEKNIQLVYVTGRALPELFSERYAFSDPDVSLSGIQQYCRQVRAGPRLAPASDAIAMID